MSNKKPKEDNHEIIEVLVFATCPKCKTRYLASDGHECPEKEK